MAVYTDITEQELRAFLADYDLGDVLSYRGIAEGVENSNFMLHTDAGEFILTLYEKRVDPDDLPFFLGLMDHLAGKGLNCPLPVRKKDGALTGTLAGRPAAIITFLEGMWLRRPQPANCAALGRAMAQFHLAGEGFSLKRENAMGMPHWRPLWDRCEKAAGPLDHAAVAETESDLEELEANWPLELPAGVIHADLFPDNVFFLGEKLSGIIDFYFACNDLFAYDVAIGLNAWCFEKDNAYNLTKGSALLAGYQEVRPLSDEEVAALPVLARGSALRFMLTRLYDWINTPDGSLVVKKDPMEYLTKMRFHRSVGSASEYGLI